MDTIQQAPPGTPAPRTPGEFASAAQAVTGAMDRLDWERRFTAAMAAADAWERRWLTCWNTYATAASTP